MPSVSMLLGLLAGFSVGKTATALIDCKSKDSKLSYIALRVVIKAFGLERLEKNYMNEGNYNFDQISVANLDLDQSRRNSESAMADIASQTWSMPKTEAIRMPEAKTLLEGSVTGAVGAGSGALLAMGGLYAKDRATEVAVNIVRLPLSIGLTMITGRAVYLPNYTIETNLARIAPKGALVGAAVGLAAYGAHKIYQNYYSDSAEKK